MEEITDQESQIQAIAHRTSFRELGLHSGYSLCCVLWFEYVFCPLWQKGWLRQQPVILKDARHRLCPICWLRYAIFGGLFYKECIKCGWKIFRNPKENCWMCRQLEDGDEKA